MIQLDRYLREVPKAELHIHLEGSIRPETLLELAKRNGVTLPATDLAGLKEWFRFTDFKHFIQVYVGITRCLRTTRDYELIVYELGSEFARQNVRYAEVTFTPKTHEWLGIGEDIYFEGLRRGRERVEEDFGVRINWIFDIVRLVEDHERNSDYTLGVALDGRRHGVVALGLGGNEAEGPAELFAPWFEKAKAEGLASVPHAGETAGPRSVWAALRELKADRIGHGVRSIEDPELVRYLAEHGIPLEISPTSNLRIGVYPDYASHPFRELYEAGVIVTINSDDPPLFNTSLNEEVELLHSEFGLDREQIDEILLNGVRHSLLGEEEKHALEQTFKNEMTRLARETSPEKETPRSPERPPEDPIHGA